MEERSMGRRNDMLTPDQASAIVDGGVASQTSSAPIPLGSRCRTQRATPLRPRVTTVSPDSWSFVDARSYLTISNSPIDEALAAAAIRSRDTIIARAQAVAEQNLATLDAFVAEHVELLGWVRPAGGLTAFPWLRSGADSRPLCIDAAAAGVLVAPGDCFDVPSHFRIGFGAAEHGFVEAVTRLGEVLAKHG
jgi:DNA-binding transcriptional MocR family regulator